MGTAVMASDQNLRFESLFQRFYRRVVAFLMHLGFSLDDARDLAQETFLRVYKNMDAYRGEAEWAFLRTTAHNLAKNRIRDNSAQKRKVTRVTIEEIADPIDPAPPPDEVMAVREETARFRDRYAAAVASLSGMQRECFLLRHQGYSYDEIAAVLRIPVNSVKSRLHDAKKRLKEVLGAEPQGIDWPEAAGDRDDRQE